MSALPSPVSAWSLSVNSTSWCGEPGDFRTFQSEARESRSTTVPGAMTSGPWRRSGSAGVAEEDAECAAAGGDAGPWTTGRAPPAGAGLLRAPGSAPAPIPATAPAPMARTAARLPRHHDGVRVRAAVRAFSPSESSWGGAGGVTAVGAGPVPRSRSSSASSECACFHRRDQLACSWTSAPQARTKASVASRVGSLRPAAAVDKVLCAHPARRAMDR